MNMGDTNSEKDTNETDEAESRIALASTDEPSGASMRTRQVMSRRFDFIPPVAAFDKPKEKVVPQTYCDSTLYEGGYGEAFDIFGNDIMTCIV